MSLTCFFCQEPAVTIGWGFAVCGEGRHAERARLCGDPAMDQFHRDRAITNLNLDEARYRAEGRADV